MKTLCCSLGMLLFLLWFNPFCLAQVITVRVIDIRNGHPLEKLQVSISLFYEKGQPKPAKYDKIIKLETDMEGKAQINLPEPPPGYLSFGITMSSEHWHYAPITTVKTEQLIQQGIVVDVPAERKKSDFPVKAKPGEIIFPARPHSFFHRLVNPIMKG